MLFPIPSKLTSSLDGKRRLVLPPNLWQGDSSAKLIELIVDLSVESPGMNNTGNLVCTGSTDLTAPAPHALRCRFLPQDGSHPQMPNWPEMCCPQWTMDLSSRTQLTGVARSPNMISARWGIWSACGTTNHWFLTTQLCSDGVCTLCVVVFHNAQNRVELLHIRHNS
jgi:hypothetical protein